MNNPFWNPALDTPMPIDPTSPLESPRVEVTRHLTRLGIDIYAPGPPTLAQACAERGLAVEGVVKDLEALPSVPRRDWMEAPLVELVHHIVHHHHTFTREELVRIGQLLDRAGTEGLPGRIQVHFRALAEDLVTHFQMEERNLFPAICAAEHGGVTPISLSTPSEQARTITAEHEAVEELFRNIRILTADYGIPPGAGEDLRAALLALRNLEDDLHLHLFLENHILFPRALPR